MKKSYWGFGGWLIGTIVAFAMLGLGVHFPWSVPIAQMMIYFIGWIKAGIFESKEGAIKQK